MPLLPGPRDRYRRQRGRRRLSARNGRSGSASATGPVRSGCSPAGARFDVPDRFDEHSGRWDGDPPGLEPRMGSAFGPGLDRESQIAALLTVRDPSAIRGRRPSAGGNVLFGEGLERLAIAGSNRHYTEARIEAGDVVTVVGRVLPFSELSDPTTANLLDVSMVSATDPEVAADLAAARAAGQLAATPDEAWGNAAIEGFGIGRPVRSAGARSGSDAAAAAGPGDRAPAPGTPSTSRRRRSSWRAGRRRAAVRVPRRPGRRSPPVTAARSLVGLFGGGRRDRLGDDPRGPPRWARPDADARSRRASPSGCSVLIVLFFLVMIYNDVDRPRAADRQGLGEHRGRPPAAPRPAAGPRRRGPRA